MSPRQIVKLTGTYEAPIWRYDDGRARVVETGRYLTVPFKLTLSAQGRGRFTNHEGVLGDEQPRCTTYVVENLDTNPAHSTGHDNTGREYELLTWLGPFVPGRQHGDGRFVELEIQTWDRHTIFISGWYLQRDILKHASTIAELDEPSQAALVALLDQRRQDYRPTVTVPMQLGLL
ncbi:MAG: hypothetical protein KKA73_07860 [Chloroflexi bacterium]|nr:hypothetical protein [Chloroflexota bacterium]MBU1747588.1 hypothetical protein [Chloroflexota bacterium]